MKFGIAFIAVVWIGFIAMCVADPMCVCGIFFPLVLTGMGLDLIEASLSPSSPPTE